MNLESRGEDHLFRPEMIAERVSVWAESNESKVLVGLWPADTVSQAQRFFDVVDRTTFLGLDGWDVSPNLHFSSMNTHLIWTKTNWPVDRYFDLFAGGQRYGKMDQAKLVPLANQWEEEGIITSDIRGNIEYQFTSTKRETLNVIPGFLVIRGWGTEKRDRLGRKGRSRRTSHQRTCCSPQNVGRSAVDQSRT